MCITFIKSSDDEKWIKFHQTERVSDNLNPEFTQKPKIPFSFGSKQLIKFKIIDSDQPEETDDVNKYDDLGHAECSLGEILSHNTVSIIYIYQSRQ